MTSDPVRTRAIEIVPATRNDVEQIFALLAASNGDCVTRCR